MLFTLSIHLFSNHAPQWQGVLGCGMEHSVINRTLLRTRRVRAALQGELLNMHRE